MLGIGDIVGGCVVALAALAGLALWISCLRDCCRRDSFPDHRGRAFWLRILRHLWLVGAIIYYCKVKRGGRKTSHVGGSGADTCDGN